MIAVTIGIGSAFREVAAIAAERMRCFTGLNVVVLSEADMVRWVPAGDATRWGLRACLLMKLRLFDIFKDDRILYFDADAFPCRPWCPESLGEPDDFVCTRDLVDMEHIQVECAQAGLDPDTYFNAGFFIAGRSAHEPMFRTASQLMDKAEDAVPLFFEQTYMNLAARKHRVDIRFVDRRFNYLRWNHDDEMAASTPVVMIHAAGDGDDKWRLLNEVRSTDLLNTCEYDGDQMAELSNKYFKYHRVDHDQRAIELRPDGTIGHGAASLETRWFVRAGTVDAAPTLVIGNHREITCELQRDNGCWTGRWRRHEKMPVQLEKHRGQVLVELAGRVAASDRPCEVAEIGVNDGETSAILLKQCPSVRLWMVDHWSTVPHDTDYWKDGDPAAIRSLEVAEAAFFKAVRVTEPWRGRRRIIKADHEAAARLLPDRSLDMAFLDADHSLNGTLRAMEVWIEKVRPGGVLCGHDFDYPGKWAQHVAEAVRQFCCGRGLSFEVTDDYVWLLTVKP